MENGEIHLQQFLQSLCTDSPWSYAIFWKLHQHHIFLTCEDGYFDYSRLQGSAQSILDDGYTRQENASNYIPVTNLSDEQSLGHSIRVAIADMSCHRYQHGEGTVGMAAASGSDLWIYFDDKKSVEFLSTPKYPDEWHLATTVGIKTTLLAPVMPHGVLQLGSLKKVPQNPELVGTIIDRFNCDFSSFTFDKNTLPSSSSQMKDIDKDGSSIGSSIFNTWLKHDYFAGNLTTDTGGEEFSYGNEVLASSILDNFLHMQDNPIFSPFEYDIDLSYMYQDLDSESTAFTEFLMDDIVDNPEEGCSNDRVSGESFSGNYDYLFHDETQVVPTFDMDHEEDCINLEHLDDFLKGFEMMDHWLMRHPTQNRWIKALLIHVTLHLPHLKALWVHFLRISKRLKVVMRHPTQNHWIKALSIHLSLHLPHLKASLVHFLKIISVRLKVVMGCLTQVPRN